MKWMMTTVLSILIGISLSIQTHANYQNFESMTIIDGTLLSDIEENDYQEALDKVSKRKFWGWKIHYIHERIKVSYIKETLFSFYNDGKTPFEYEYQAT
ncbi:MAG: hypothetical protein ACPGCR_02625, partial [Acholeplasmataceae bacterium]